MFVLIFHTSWTTGELPEDRQKAHEARQLTEGKPSSLGNRRLVSLTLIEESSGLMGRVSKVTVFFSPHPFMTVTTRRRSWPGDATAQQVPSAPLLICIAASSCSDRHMWVRVEKGLKYGSVISSHQHGFVEKSCQMSLALLFSEITSLTDKGSCFSISVGQLGKGGKKDTKCQALCAEEMSYNCC